ncbi:hypothetical protein OUZ56_022843 [Daphnia magna]|uniref:Uncharacterized protein n=1 Tax=Daphnia magna TaxID=35525 RepID=A0ABR0AXM4_9CRUS|nr:hypothetical protein OUZ56_022843 [Daphnia magna]
MRGQNVGSILFGSFAMQRGEETSQDFPWQQDEGGSSSSSSSSKVDGCTFVGDVAGQEIVLQSLAAATTPFPGVSLPSAQLSRVAKGITSTFRYGVWVVQRVVRRLNSFSFLFSTKRESLRKE